MQIQILKEKIKNIKKKLFKQSSSKWDGIYKSKTRGAGLLFKEHRVYSYGDEIRFIDWKLFAKTNNPYIKTFEEERNICIEYFLDLNNNLFVGYNKTFKIDALVEIFSLMCLVAKKFNDKIQLNVIYDKLYSFELSSGERLIIDFLNFLEKINLIDENGLWNTCIQKKIYDNEKKINSAILKAVSKHRPVFFFMSNLSSFDYLQRYLKHKNFHPFMILSPIEYLTNKSFSIKISHNGKNKIHDIYTQGTSEFGLSRFIKVIKMDSDYLDSFMKHVV